MKMHISKSLPALTVIACLNAPAVFANEGFYVGVQGGKSFIDTNEDIYDVDDDINFKGFAGWKFMDWLSLEVAYSQLGEFEGVYFTETTETDTTINIDAATIGLSLWGSFGWGIDVFAKLGGFYATTEWDNRSSKFDENDVGVFYEAGLLYPINDMIGVTVSWQHYEDIEILDQGTDAGVDTFDLGVVLQF